MTLTALGGALIIEQVEVIREIARNLLGEAPPAGTGLATSSVSGPAEGSWTAFSGDGTGSLNEAGVDRRGASPSGALSLVGIRPPFASSAGSGLFEIRQVMQLLADGGAAAPGTHRPASADARAGAGQELFAEAMKADGGTASAGIDGRTASALSAGKPEAAFRDAQQAASTVGRSETDTASFARASATRDGGPQPPRHDSVPVRPSPAGHMSPGRSGPDTTGADRTFDGTVSARDAAIGRTDIAVEKLLSADALAMLGLVDGAAPIGGLGADQAGIFASFILNAHMLPGWPPPRPFARIDEVFRSASLSIAPQLTENEEQILIYLLNLGLNINHIARVLKAIRSARRRSGLFTAIANLLSSATAVTHVIEVELAALVDDLLQERKLRMRMLPSARLRADLR